MNEELTIRRMQTDCLLFAQEVRALSGWNQTQKDWIRTLSYGPDGCFVAEWKGKPAGTAATVNYRDTTAWIGMVLVHPNFRRRGIATALLNLCIAHLRSTVRCIKLDATPEGKMVYNRLGFVAEYNLARWERTKLATETPGPSQTIEENDWPSLVKLDTPVFGTDRELWLRLLTRDSSRALLNRKEDGGVNAYGLARGGERAEYLGPVVADRRKDGEKLIRKLLDGAQQDTIYWDIPDDNKEAVALAEEMGFVRQRPFIRMWLGEANMKSEPGKQWAIGDPSTG